MDIKVEGITIDIMRMALEQAREGRRHILQAMLGPSSQPPSRALSPLAPRVAKISVPADKVGAVIGPQGKVVRALQGLGAAIQVDSETCSVDVSAPNADVLDQTVAAIQAIAAEVRAA